MNFPSYADHGFELRAPRWGNDAVLEFHEKLENAIARAREEHAALETPIEIWERYTWKEGEWLNTSTRRLDFARQGTSISAEELTAIKIYNDALVLALQEGESNRLALDIADLELRRAFYPREQVRERLVAQRIEDYIASHEQLVAGGFTLLSEEG